MKYRRLGRTGLRVSVIGVGTWQLGGEWGRSFTQPEVDQLLGRARELGVNLVDTAECYGDHLAEALIGGAIHQQRGEWVVATKFGHRFHPEALEQAGRSPVALRTDTGHRPRSSPSWKRRRGRCGLITWTCTRCTPALGS